MSAASSAPLHPKDTPPVQVANIPADLTELDQWVGWAYRIRDGRKTKVPLQKDLSYASTTDPTTWTSYPEVITVLEKHNDRLAGIGFVFSKDDPYVGIDLDNSLDEDGHPLPWAQPILEEFGDTYIEISPSGKGVKIFAKGKLPGSGKKKLLGDHAIEMYDRGRFFTVTGRILPWRFGRD